MSDCFLAFFDSKMAKPLAKPSSPPKVYLRIIVRILLHSFLDTAVKWSSADSSSGSNTFFNEFRLDSWFVEAVTSPKDVVILMDTSSSLSESSRHLVRLTAKTILETLGDNDFVNIFSLDNAEQNLVPCFKELLVQASTTHVIFRFCFHYGPYLTGSTSRVALNSARIGSPLIALNLTIDLNCSGLKFHRILNVRPHITQKKLRQ